MTTQPDTLIIGEIVGPFGIKGELKVDILTEFPDRFNKLVAVLIAPPSEGPGIRRQGAGATGQPSGSNTQPARFRPPKEPTLFTIESVRAHKGRALMKVAGVDDATDAEMLRGYLVTIPIEQARKLPRGSYYLYQIEGLDVYTTGGDLVGKIDEVLSMAANDVYIVRGPGVVEPAGELLVPAVKEIVKKIDVEGGRVVIAPPSEWA